MKDYRIALGQLVQDVEWTATGVHEVLREDLEPVDLGVAGKNVIEVRGAKSDADPKIGQIPTIGSHDIASV